MNLDNIEIERKQRLKKFYIFFFIGLGVLLISLIVFFIGLSNDQYFVPSFLGIAIGVIFMLLSIGINARGYDKYVKDNLEKIIMADVFKANKFTYVENNGISFKEMNYSGVFQNPDDFETSDTIRSTYKTVEFVLSDYIFTRIVVTTDSKGNTTTHRYPYPGRYMSFHLERNFESGISIIERRNNPDVFRLNLYKEKIDFESIDFNKKFAITASDKEKAFYLIRPKEIMDLLDLEKMYKGHIANIVVNNMVYFFLADVSVEFHYSIFKKISDMQISDIRAYYELPLKIIDTLNLGDMKFNTKL
jgi:hypothetical protein